MSPRAAARAKSVHIFHRALRFPSSSFPISKICTLLHVLRHEGPFLESLGVDSRTFLALIPNARRCGANGNRE